VVGNASGACRIRAGVDGGAVATTGFVVSSSSRVRGDGMLAELIRRAEASGGTSVKADDMSLLTARLNAQAMRPAADTRVRPMHSPWWMLPFSLTLGGEWWLRRRRGLR
jgi:hypothetical protein